MTVDLQPSSGASRLLELLRADERISAAIPLAVGVGGQPVDLENRIIFGPSSSEVEAVAVAEGLVLNWRAQQLGDAPVWDFQLSATNATNEAILLTRLDSAALALQGGPWRVESFASAWGDEFRPKSATTQHDSYFGVRSGRSSHGESPVVYFVRESDGFTVIVAPAWSGNWHVDVMAGGWISAGISTWNLNLTIEPNETIEAPSVIVAAATSKALAQSQLQIAVRDNWLARTAATDSVPVEWNHWWPYEDVEVTEDVILDNVRIAQDMAIDTIVVDAGWFGESKLETNWTNLRGDWSSVNLARFPSGLAKLGEEISKSGMAPGIWIELEAVGAQSELRRTLPEAMARDDSGARPDPSYRVGTVSLDPTDPGFLGYVCLGSDAGWSHAYDCVTRVISEMNARWLKMDFNIDPGYGCSRSDHGHKSGDGLLRHYEGLYRLLDQIRLDFTDLLIEACSSGGLRIDLGLAKHVHCFFLSDPDYTEHHLQVLWGAAHMLPPLAILHWPWSWWRNDYGPSQLDWAKLDVDSFDVMVRSAMFHRMGVSYPLPKMPEKLNTRLARHLQIFHDYVKPILASATLTSLTDSPLRGAGGVRNPVWQLSSKLGEPEEVHLLLSVRLDTSPAGAPEAAPEAASFNPTHLKPEAGYVVYDVETHQSLTALGKDITAQLLTRLAADARSWILEIRPQKVEL